MADIFISYAREDHDTAEKLAAVLEAEHWSVWWDRSLLAGDDWLKIIERELNQARCVVVLWSRAGVASDFVVDEARRGFKRSVLIPVLIERVDIPLGFGGRQAEDLTGWSGGITPASERVQKAVEAKLGPSPKKRQHEGPPSVGSRRNNRRRRVALATVTLALLLFSGFVLIPMLLQEPVDYWVMTFVAQEESRTLIEKLRTELRQAGYEVDRVRAFPDSEKGNASVRNKVFFFFPKDREAAEALETYVEQFLREAGRDVEMETDYFAKDPDALQGQLELWLFLPAE